MGSPTTPLYTTPPPNVTPYFMKLNEGGTLGEGSIEGGSWGTSKQLIAG